MRRREPKLCQKRDMGQSLPAERMNPWDAARDSSPGSPDARRAAAYVLSDERGGRRQDQRVIEKLERAKGNGLRSRNAPLLQ